MVIGLGMWIFGSSPAPASGASGSPLATGFAESQSASGGSGTSPAFHPDSPALFRLGGGYIVGFFLGWWLRKSIKMALWFLGLAVALGFVAQHYGLFEWNPEAWQAHLSRSLAWLKGESGAIQEFFTGYIPTSVSGMAGVIVGLTRK